MADPWDDFLARQRGSQIADLRWHWGEAYEIGWTDGKFTAERRDDGDLLTASSAEELYERIAADYRNRPVSREYGP
jgi:hypothetical protein